MMQAAANTLRRFRRAATLLLALTVILGVVFLVDQQGVGPAAGRWTITQVTNGPEGPSLPAAKVGDQFLVLPNGYAVPSGSCLARRDRLGALRLEMLYLQRPQQIRAISHRPRRRRAHVHAHKPRRVRGGRGAQTTSARPRQNAQIAERGERAVSHLSFATRLSGVNRT